MIPKRERGSGQNGDRRDSLMLLADCARSTCPMRDLVRAREDAVSVSTQAKYRLKAFLLRQGRRYPGREGWTLPYRRWLTDLSFPSAPQHNRPPGVSGRDR